MRTLVSLAKMCTIPRFCRRISKVGVHSIQGKEDPTPPTWLEDSGLSCTSSVVFPSSFPLTLCVNGLSQVLVFMLSQSFRVFCFFSVRLLLLAFISSCLLSCIVCSFCRHLSWYLLLAVWLKILAPLEYILLKTLYGDTHLVLHVRCQSPKGQVYGVHKQTPMTDKKQLRQGRIKSPRLRSWVRKVEVVPQFWPLWQVSLFFSQFCGSYGLFSLGWLVFSWDELIVYSQ
jgi:hypothetical protein